MKTTKPMLGNGRFIMEKTQNQRKGDSVMKRKNILWLSLILVCAVVARPASATMLVKLLWDDAPALTTANLGSLGGTQNLSGYNGWGAKDSGYPSAPTAFNSGTSWWSMFVATSPPATYGDYQLPALSATTVAFWVNPGHILGWRNIFASNDTGGNGSANDMLGAFFEGATGGTTGNLHFQANGGYNLDVANALTVGTWTHVAVSYDSAGGPTKVYIDGVDTAFTGVWTGSIATGTAGITIGTPGADYYGFNGHLDNFFVFDSALTQQQVQLLMAYNDPNHVPEPSILALFVLGGVGALLRKGKK